MAQLTCSSLALGYEGHIVLKGLDFLVNTGDYLCIVGENGSGKSTLMKTMSTSMTMNMRMKRMNTSGFPCATRKY